jgi:hypothetical protein
MLVTHRRTKQLSQSDLPAGVVPVVGRGLHAADGDGR